MTLKKSDIVDSVRKNVRVYIRAEPKQRFLFPEMKYGPLDQNRAARIVESLFELMKNALARGEEVRITGFGKFYVRVKWARKGRNPATGQSMMIRPRRVVLFRPSRKFRNRLNTQA
jgi:integration host factor subunit alpha